MKTDFVKEILREIEGRCCALRERINNRLVDRHVANELENRFEALQSLYWWIKEGGDANH